MVVGNIVMSPEEPTDIDVIAPASSVPTRRAFVIAGATFVMGAALGGTSGYSLAARGNVPPTGPDETHCGDEELEELRRLAVKAPMEELIERRLNFTYSTFHDYPKDPVLWQGIERLCDATLGGAPMPDRRVFALALAGVIEKGDPALTQGLISRVEELKRVK